MDKTDSYGLSDLGSNPSENTKIIGDYMKKFILYLLRWQLSSPILYLCLNNLKLNNFWNTIIANLIGGCIFF